MGRGDSNSGARASDIDGCLIFAQAARSTMSTDLTVQGSRSDSRSDVVTDTSIPLLNPYTPPMSSSYRDLKVWQRSIDLAENIYHLTSEFPAAEMDGLTSQMRRAAVSIASNIAEGWG